MSRPRLTLVHGARKTPRDRLLAWATKGRADLKAVALDALASGDMATAEAATRCRDAVARVLMDLVIVPPPDEGAE